MNKIECVQHNAEKIIGLLEQFKKASKLLKESQGYRNEEEEKYFPSTRIISKSLEIIQYLNETEFPLLGIKENEGSESVGYSYNFINGLMTLGRIGALFNEYGFFIDVKKRRNNADKFSKINFCMNDKERKKSIKNIKNCLIDFDEVYITKYGDYTLKIIVKNKQIECATLAKIVEIIISNLINDNDNGSDNKYLKYINKLLVENI
ncbi:hypothetical protein KQI36_14480 [Clostridium senegalense]|uniref:hypothetical protein n=1 Tax=Clostridium senegalense TaxID=1465809 RepID=UPI001C0F7608|nr:hypothetical protein [Clostridium senegalense]MBU5227838.1 hypothetical protein [Clostridium senegalense]